MIIADTSVWIDHLRNGNDHLVDLLNEGKITVHPFIIGELACGNIQNRTEILTSLQALPQALSVQHDELLYFIESNQLMANGVGYIDLAILASSILTSLPLWTLDKKLRSISTKLDMCYLKP